jgi:hypothetical protein
MESVEPILKNLRIDSELPSDTKSKILNPLPRQATPYRLMLLPILHSDLTLMLLPTEIVSKIDSDDPRRVMP